MRPVRRSLALAALLVLGAAGASAQGYSLLDGGGLYAARQPLFDRPLPEEEEQQPLIQARAEVADTAEAEEARGRAQSLFIGRASHGFFAPFAPRDRSRGSALPGGLYGADEQVVMLRSLIAKAEAGRDGYDAVQHGARIRPALPPTQMTLGEIFAWIKATPRQPHAIGRYQFIPSTLARLVEIAGASAEDRFSPEMQDRLADILLQEAGLDAFRSGTLSRHGFMNNLAKIWAGFPNSSGRSHYHGYAGNAATMTWDRFDREMAAIFES
jgi:muramidase (phage lysozyme)